MGARASLGFVVLFSLAIGVGAWLTTAEDLVPCDGGPTVRTEYQYVGRAGANPQLTSLDVHAVPGARNCPIVLWVHGGSWQVGDKRSSATTRKAEHFTANGWVFVSINHRLAADDNDIRWPDFGEDVAAAIDWTIDNSAAFGGDGHRVSLLGHSAGAHLVSIVGTNPTLLESRDRSLGAVRCVVSLDSVTHDLTEPPPWEVDIIDLAFPTTEQQVDGSPTLQTGSMAAGPEVLIVTRGRSERIDSSHALAGAIQEREGAATVVDVSPYDHGEVSTMLGVVGEQIITPLVDEFLTTCR